MSDASYRSDSSKRPELPDDLVLPFRAEASGVIGRLVRLGASVDTVLGQHGYPEPVSKVLGEALVLSAMIGAALKNQSKLILQTQTDGPLGFLVTNYNAPGNLRGYASFDSDRLQALGGTSADDKGTGDIGALGHGAIDPGALLGKGHFAMTIDPGSGMDRYQGIVALEGEPLVVAAHTYFRQSEQLPTFIRIAVARHFSAGTWQWRAGGLIIQSLARAGGHQPLVEDDAGNALRVAGEDEDWERTQFLAATVEDHELLDPLLSPERLLYRLFHEEGVRAYPAKPIGAECGCSRERIEAMLTRFGDEELADMREDDGSIRVTCEFCKQSYEFPG